MGGSGWTRRSSTGDRWAVSSRWALAPLKDASTNATAMAMAARTSCVGPDRRSDMTDMTPQDDDRNLVAADQPQVAMQPPEPLPRQGLPGGLGQVAREEAGQPKRAH